MNGIDVSVIIPVKNGQRCLDSVLRAVFSQEINAKFEVIIVDSGSKYKTLDIIARYPVKYYQIKKAEFNHGLTRNYAISKSCGRYIVLMTQDAIPYNNRWMERLVNNFECDQRVAGVYCRQVPREDADILTKRDLDRHFTARKERVISFVQNVKYEFLTPMERYKFCNFDNVCSCIRKGVWEKICFSETDFAEDLDWSKRVLEAGYKIIYEPEAQVIHSHKRHLLYEYRRSYIHHKRLYELFQFQPVPTLKKAILFSLCNIFGDINYVFKKRKGYIETFQLLLRIPLASFLKSLAQFRGARDAKSSGKCPQ